MRLQHLWLLLLASSACALPGSAQTRIQAHPCVEKNGQYTCNKAAFKKILAASHTISVHVPSHDVFAASQLAQVARSMGKTIQPSSADLIFELTLPEPDGIDSGPGDRELATIRVYGRGLETKPGELLWIESYSGQPDTPPATVAHAIIDQFRRDLR